MISLTPHNRTPLSASDNTVSALKVLPCVSVSSHNSLHRLVMIRYFSGQSALVLSHSQKEQTFSLGFLSLPYNRGRSSVSVPVLSFHSESFNPLYNSPQDVENALHDVTIHTGL